MSVNIMLALLRKLRGPSLVARRNFDDKAWNLLHSQIEVADPKLQSCDVLNSEGQRPHTDISSGFGIPIAF